MRRGTRRGTPRRAAAQIGDARAVRVDLADTASLSLFAAKAGPMDILVNNTGGPPYGTAVGRTLEDWQGSFTAMSLSVIHLTDLFMPAMRAAGWGRVLTVVSSGAVQPIPLLGISNTLRAGLIAWSKSVATEVAKDGVTVNVLMPGRIETDRVRATDEATAKTQSVSSMDDVRQRSIAQIPMGRYGAPGGVGRNGSRHLQRCCVLRHWKRTSRGRRNGQARVK